MYEIKKDIKGVPLAIYQMIMSDIEQKIKKLNDQINNIKNDAEGDK